MDFLSYLIAWFRKFCPEPSIDDAAVARIDTGTRSVVAAGSAEESSSMTSACQYWVKGLPAPCIQWKAGTCTYAVDSGETPTGYGIGQCDGLGRRDWCSKYEALVGYTIDSYTCILPSIEKSGSGKQMSSVSEYVSLRPWKIDEIKGFNPDGSGVGQCDGVGMGRGIAGIGTTTVSEMRKLFPVCKHYKPHIMSFGAIVPRPFHSDPREPSQYSWKEGTTYLPTTLEQLHDGSKADPLVLMDKRLPYVFKVYNLRASIQKCAHWDDDNAAYFDLEYYGPDPAEFKIVLDKIPLEKCECEDSACDPYKLLETDSEGYTEGAVPKFLEDIWAQNGSVVCNGAKPECPCYTGKWLYCIDDKMADGMRITANQLLELRFWTSQWASQEEYDLYFTQRPNKTDDSSTPDVYTFTEWRQKDEAVDVNDVVPVGKKHHMCMPRALNSKIFDPEKYITITDQSYLPAVGHYGTGTQGPGDTTFPTLIRDLSEEYVVFPDIEVVYPYFTRDPWSVAPCKISSDESELCEHANIKMSGNPTIAVVGSTVRNRDIVVINATLFDKAAGNYAISLMKHYVRLNLVPEKLREEFFTSLSSFVDYCSSIGSAGIIFTQSDKHGYFIAEGLELKNNFDNDIFILCRTTSLDYYNVYVYTRRTVKSAYYGAYFTQTSFSQPAGNDGGNDLPAAYGSPVLIEGLVIPINGNVDDVHQVHGFVSQGLSESSSHYGYCINRTEVEIESLIDWTQIGTTRYIYADLGSEQLRITYQFGFEVEEAYLTLTTDEDGEPSADNINLCGNTADTKINLKRVSINSNRELPPGALILKADTVLGFANSDWTLYIKYKYMSLDTWRGSDVAWPKFEGTTYFGLPSWSVDFKPVNSDSSEGTALPVPFSINGMKVGTAQIMAKISDASGRIQAFAATKMIFYGHKQQCRNADIFYSWSMDAEGHHLNPMCGWAVNIEKDGNLPGIFVHRRTPECGDHECGLGCTAVGPLWYPYESCDSDEFYTMYSAGAYCAQRIMCIEDGESQVEKNRKLMGPSCWRYAMPDEYRAWVDECAAWLEACGVQNRCYYSKTVGELKFAGWARKKTKVDPDEYHTWGWQLPPFGNNGKAQVERWFFRDFISFIKTEGANVGIGHEYAPMVFDRPDLQQDLDCFAYTAEGSYDFSFFSIMSTLLADYNGESYQSEDYYRFEEIIDLVYQGGCSYPAPIIYQPDNMNRVAVRYGFKEENICWAWPTRWYDIDRGQEAGVRLYFLGLIYPDYYFDYPKREHRLTVDEREHRIEFIPPSSKSTKATSPDGEAPEDDTESIKYASISINGAYPRYFNIMYDDYTSGYVEWKDESTTGEEDASGGSDNDGDEQSGSIYECANNDPDELEGEYTPDKTIWIHDFDTLFSDEASKERVDERRAVIAMKLSYNPDSYSGPVFGHYNRGLIAKIPKSLLNRLPLDENDLEGNIVTEENMVDAGSITYNFDLSGSEYTAATKITVYGTWGFSPATIAEEAEGGLSNVFSKPGIQLSEVFEEDYDESIGMVFREDCVVEDTHPKSGYSSLNELGENIIDAFKLELLLSTYPNRMNRKVKYFQVRLVSSLFLGKHESLDIKNVTVTVGKYRSETEVVKCWERFYQVSRQSVSPNPDGPDTKKWRVSASRDGKIAGQYFPDDESSNIEIMSKTTFTTCGKYYEEDEEVVFTSPGALRDFELSGQEELYNEAYSLESYDTVNFTGFVPTYIKDLYTHLNMDVVQVAPGCTMTEEKVDWESNIYKGDLNQKGSHFQPGGHYHSWTPSVTLRYCRSGNNQEVEIMHEQQFNHPKHGGSSTTMWVGHVFNGFALFGEDGYLDQRIAVLDADPMLAPEGLLKSLDEGGVPIF